MNTVQDIYNVKFGTISYSFILETPFHNLGHSWIRLSLSLFLVICSTCPLNIWNSSRFIHGVFFLLILNISPGKFYLAIAYRRWLSNWCLHPRLFIYLSSPLGYLQNQNYTLASILYLPGISYPPLPLRKTPTFIQSCKLCFLTSDFPQPLHSIPSLLLTTVFYTS